MFSYVCIYDTDRFWKREMWKIEGELRFNSRERDSFRKAWHSVLLWLCLLICAGLLIDYGRIICRVSGVPFPRRRYGLWYGNSPDLQDQRRIPWQDDAHILCLPFTQGFRHSRGAIQCDIICSSISWERRWVYGPRQWSFIWYLLQNLEAGHTYL